MMHAQAEYGVRRTGSEGFNIAQAKQSTSWWVAMLSGREGADLT
jgi:hypothetical protein